MSTAAQPDEAMNSNRRSFLQAILGACVAATTNIACRSSAEDSGSSEGALNDGVYDCLILGGGMSGMAAANALAYARPNTTINAKNRSVLVIEGQGQLGGRTKTHYDMNFGGPIELGAQYLHVDDEKDDRKRRLSLWNTFREYGIRTAALNRFIHGAAYSKFFEKLRVEWSVVFELPLKHLLAFRDDITEYRGPDMSCREWIEQGPADVFGKHKKPFPENVKPLVDLFLSGPAGGRTEQLSLRGHRLDRFATLEEGHHEYKIIEGWKAFYDQIKRAPKGISAPDIAVVYNSRVTNIEYSADGVIVTVEERYEGKEGPAPETSPVVTKTYRAKTAILTFPIGVLRRATGIDAGAMPSPLTFSPPLPDKKVAVLRTIGKGVGAKMFIAFKERFWDEKTNFLSRLDGLSKMGRTYFFSNQGGDPAKNYTIGALLTGGEAEKIEGWTEDQVLRGICDELADIYPEADAKQPIYDRVRLDANGKKVAFLKHWSNDPWAYGIDSYLEFGKESTLVPFEHARAMLASEEDTPNLFWAGEATYYDDNSPDYSVAHAGFTHGAHASGLRAAKEVTSRLDGKTKR